jgi:hypothetical protein
MIKLSPLVLLRSSFPKTLRGKAAVKRYWEIIADNLSKAGWTWGCVAAIDSSTSLHHFHFHHRMNLPDRVTFRRAPPV